LIATSSLGVLSPVVNSLTVGAPSGMTLETNGLTPTELLGGDSIQFVRTSTVWRRVK
jgi:hypothetical protein